MKKTLLLVLCAAIAPAFAATPTGFDMFTALSAGSTSSSGDLIISDIENGNGMRSIGLAETTTSPSALYTHNGTDRQASSSFTFSLNLSTIQNTTITENTELVTFDYNDTDIGLFLTTEKKLYSYWGTMDANATARLSLDLFDTDGNVLSSFENNTYLDAEGNTCLTLTVTMNAIKSQASSYKGMQVYSNSASLGTDVGLGTTSGNDIINAINFNSNLITQVAVTPCTLDATNAQAAAQALPEPTTTTLSLLALAGLAARRRRK